MNEYETVCVLQPDLPEGKLGTIKEKVEKILKEHQAIALEQKDWGKRKLAYRIGKFDFGHYLYFNFQGGGNFVSSLERTLQYEEGILRYLTVRLSKDIQPDSKVTKKVTEAEEANLSVDEYRQSDRY